MRGTETVVTVKVDGRPVEVYIYVGADPLKNEVALVYERPRDGRGRLHDRVAFILTRRLSTKHPAEAERTPRPARSPNRRR